MRCLVLSDIHGNLPAFEQVVKIEKDIDLYINLGDVVNYGPWSNECVDLIDSLNCFNILGNHEEYFIKGKCDVKNDVVQSFFDTNYLSFNRFDLITEYRNKILFKDFLLTHNLTEKGYVFKDTKVTLEMNTIIGHSHQQYVRFENDFILINPGSIGQNRRDIEFSNYIIWDTDKNTFVQKKLFCNPTRIIQEFTARKFPEICINYYKNKIK